jgi:hypothetical protein
MLKLDQHLVQMLNDNKYVVSYDTGSITIKMSSGKQLESQASLTIVIFAFFFGVNPTIILLVLLLLLVPILYDRWRFPKMVTFNIHEEAVYIKKGILLGNSVAILDIFDLYGEKNELSSDVSAFKEGNTDYIYKLFLSTKSGKVHKLLRLQFREERDGQISQLTRYLKNLKPVK